MAEEKSKTVTTKILPIEISGDMKITGVKIVDRIIINVIFYGLLCGLLIISVGFLVDAFEMIMAMISSAIDLLPSKE